MRYNITVKLEQLDNVLKKLEGVYKSTVDAKQKQRVKIEISKIKGQMNDIKQFGPEEVLEEDEEQEKRVVIREEDVSEKEKKEFKILPEFPIKRVHPMSTDPEVNAAITYINVFESELWGALSDFHLKLDYFHSRERDKFYNTFGNVKRFITEYVHTLDEFDGSSNTFYVEKLKLMKNKHSRSLLVDSVKFVVGINEFIAKLVKDYESNGNIIINADEKISFSNIEGNKLFNKWTIIDALRYIRDFCEEFLEAIKLPDEMLNID